MIESLESRIAPAVFILPTDTTSKGVLNLVHDPASANSADNALLVQTGEMAFSLIDAGNMSVIDTYTNVKTINYTGGSAADSFKLTLNSENLFGSVTLKGGDGGDFLTIDSDGNNGARVLGDVTFDGGNGNDVLVHSFITVGKSLKLIGGADNDTTAVSGAVIPKISVTNVENASLNTGGFAVVGTLAIDNRGTTLDSNIFLSAYAFSGAVSYLGGSGMDTITTGVGTVFAKTLTVSTGAGNSTFYSGSVHNGSVSVTGGAGDDFATIQGHYGAGAKFALGDGTNQVNVTATATLAPSLIGTLDVKGGVNGDTVYFSSYTTGGVLVTPVIQNVKLALGNGSNSVDFSSGAKVLGSFSATAGLDSDTFNLTNGQVTGAIKIDAGAGANSLSLGVGSASLFTAGGLSYKGGAGVDSLVFGSVSIGNAVSITLGDGANTIANSATMAEVPYFTGTTVSIKGGKDVDNFVLTRFFAPQAKMSVYSYAGDDVLTFAGASTGFLIDGGPGFETFDLSGLRVVTLTQKNL